MQGFSKKQIKTMDELVREYIREMKISSGINEQRIFAAWDRVTGASAYTLGKYVRNNVLYCTISSSVVRSRLFPRREEIVKKINEQLMADDMFVRDDPGTGLLRYIVFK